MVEPRGTGLTLFSVRAADEDALRNLIEAVARRADSGLLLAISVSGSRSALPNSVGRTVLDQFEEFLILAKPEARKEFSALVTCCTSISL